MITKVPSVAVVAPKLVPTITTDAPDTGKPLVSTALPEITARDELLVVVPPFPPPGLVVVVEPPPPPPPPQPDKASEQTASIDNASMVEVWIGFHQTRLLMDGTCLRAVHISQHDRFRRACAALLKLSVLLNGGEFSVNDIILQKCIKLSIL